MFQGLDNSKLYSAYLISAVFIDNIGNQEHAIGTCFFVADKNQNLHLFTNRHMVDINYKRPLEFIEKHKDYRLWSLSIIGKYSGSSDLFPREDSRLCINLATSALNFPKNELDDVVDIFPHFLLESQHAMDVRVDYTVPYSMLANEQAFMDKFEIGDMLAFPGFSNGYDKLASRPILRTGILSSDPRFKYHYNEVIQGDCLLFEAFSFGGSSGSPIFALQKGFAPSQGIVTTGYREFMCIGINAGHIDNKNQHSGLSYFYKSTVLLDLIDSCSSKLPRFLPINP
jgi:hypothetical protein